MKKKNIISIILLATVVVAGYYFLWSPKTNPSSPVATVTNTALWKFPASATKLPSTGSVAGGDLAYSALPDPGGIPSGLPLRLQIPIIGVDSAIEDALITPDGRMDVPAGTEDVAWFALGPQPGQVGSSVIGGHYGIQNNVPFVFYDLNKLKVGDNVYTTNDQGETFKFVIRSIKSFGLNDDATTVFTSKDSLAHLNLITCEGIWNAVNGNYPDRLVIFTDLVPGNGSVPVTLAPATTGSAESSSEVTATTFSQSLGFGASGASVVTLQTFLEERGLLELPKGVTNGFFGLLTSVALGRYQTSQGLPPVGVLGPLTRARLNSQLTTNAISILPNTGVGSVTPTSTPIGSVINSITWFQIFIQYVKSLYATVLDGLITSLLLIAVVFVVFKIIKR